jgi:hypothetical protein
LENIIPEGGVELLPETEINKFIVSPQPTSAQKQEEFDRKQQELWSRGWGLRASLFTSFDIDRLTVSLMNQYRANPKMMKYRDELMELAENQPRHFVPAHQRRE